MKRTTSTPPDALVPRDEPMRADSDLTELWRFYARRASDTGLVLCVGVSILVIAAFAVVGLTHARWAMRWWPLALPAVLAGTFGAWGIADRELAERRADAATRRPAIRALVAVEWASCTAAALAVAAAVVMFLRLAVGTWIS